MEGAWDGPCPQQANPSRGREHRGTECATQCASALCRPALCPHCPVTPPFPGVNIINAQMKPKDVLPITPQRAPNCLPGACGRQERTQQHLQEPLGVYSFIFPKIHLRGPQSLCKIHKTHELGRFPPFHHPSVPPGNTIKMTSPPGPRSS